MRSGENDNFNKTAGRKRLLLKSIWFAAIAAAALLLTGLIGFRVYQQVESAASTVIELKLSWYYYDEEGRKQYTVLPNDIALHDGRRELVLYNNNVKECPSGTVICTRAGYYRPYITRHGNELYRYDDSLYAQNLQPEEPLYCTATINNEYIDDPVAVAYHIPEDTAADGYVFNIPAVYAGTEKALFLFNCRDFIPSFIIIMGLMLTAVCSLAGWFYYKNTLCSARLLDIFVFLCIFVLWSLTAPDISRYISDRYGTPVTGYLSYLSYMSFIIPLISLAGHTADEERAFWDRLSGLIIFNIFIQLCLNIIFRISLNLMLPATNCLLAAVALTVIIRLWLIYMKTGSRDIVKLAAAIMFMSISGLASELVYQNLKLPQELILQIGVMLASAYMVYDIYIRLAAYRTMKRKLEMDGTRHLEPVSGLSDAYMLENDIEWLRQQCRTAASDERLSLRDIAAYLKKSEAVPVDSGYLRIDIWIFSSSETDAEAEPEQKLRRLAAAGLFVRSIFTENVSCYCISSDHICVLTSERRSMAEEDIRRFRRAVDSYNHKAEYDYDRIRAVISGCELVL